MFEFAQPVIDFVFTAFAPFVGLWDAFALLLDGFAQWGVGGISDAITQYGGAPKANPTWQMMAGIYLIARHLPSFVGVYFVGKGLDLGKRMSLLLAVASKVLSIGIMNYALGIRPTLHEQFDAVAYGPESLVSGMVGLWSNDPISGATATSLFVLFVLLSYALWYSINLLLWAFSTIRAQPFFKESSIKAHAVWMTVIWLFYLSMDTPEMAFVNTLLILILVIANRSDVSLGGNSNEMTEEERVELVEQALISYLGDPPQQGGVEEESGEGGGVERVKWE